MRKILLPTPAYHAKQPDSGLCSASVATRCVRLEHAQGCCPDANAALPVSLTVRLWSFTLQDVATASYVELFDIKRRIFH
jgi:hypothetical protein